MADSESKSRGIATGAHRGRRNRVWRPWPACPHGPALRNSSSNEPKPGSGADRVEVRVGRDLLGGSSSRASGRGRRGVEGPVGVMAGPAGSTRRRRASRGRGRWPRGRTRRRRGSRSGRPRAAPLIVASAIAEARAWSPVRARASISSSELSRAVRGPSPGPRRRSRHRAEMGHSRVAIARAEVGGAGVIPGEGDVHLLRLGRRLPPSPEPSEEAVEGGPVMWTRAAFGSRS